MWYKSKCALLIVGIVVGLVTICVIGIVHATSPGEPTDDHDLDLPNQTEFNNSAKIPIPNQITELNIRITAHAEYGDVTHFSCGASNDSSIPTKGPCPQFAKTLGRLLLNQKMFWKDGSLNYTYELKIDHSLFWVNVRVDIDTVYGHKYGYWTYTTTGHHTSCSPEDGYNTGFCSIDDILEFHTLVFEMKKKVYDKKWYFDQFEDNVQSFDVSLNQM